VPWQAASKLPSSRATGLNPLIARRTVAKYREALRIPSSVQRKREKAVPA